MNERRLGGNANLYIRTTIGRKEKENNVRPSRSELCTGEGGSAQVPKTRENLEAEGKDALIIKIHDAMQGGFLRQRSAMPPPEQTASPF